MEKKTPKFEKFHVSLSTKVLSLIICAICCIAYILITYFDRTTHLAAFWIVLSEILLVVVSVFGTNLILSILIESKSKNAMLTDFMANDIIASPDFYDNLSDDNKHKMLDALTLSTDLKGNVDMLQMTKTIQQKLLEVKKDYYFENCDFTISIEDKGSYFEKTITRQITLCPYDGELKINNFSFMKVCMIEDQAIKPFTWQSIKISESTRCTEVDINSDIEECDIIKTNDISKKNGYNFAKEYIYKKPIVIKKDIQHLTTIALSYIVRCPKNDIFSTYRTAAPCKKFSVKCTITPSQKYKLYAGAFGFMDNASSSANNRRDNEINISLKDWAFVEDGVAIAIYEK